MAIKPKPIQLRLNPDRAKVILDALSNSSNHCTDARHPDPYGPVYFWLKFRMTKAWPGPNVTKVESTGRNSDGS